MPLLSSDDRAFLDALSRLAYCNPFTPQRIELERVALGTGFDEAASTWSKQSDWDRERPNVIKLRERCTPLANELRCQLADRAATTERELDLYENLIAYLLYDRYRAQFATASEHSPGQGKQQFAFWAEFRKDAQHYLPGTGVGWFSQYDVEHLFACCFQVCRAFRQIFHHIFGGSTPAAQLRARVWQSIFTHDMRRYRRSLFTRMADFTTLITGPSGTGKELVARAISLSRYVPLEGKRGASQDGLEDCFFPLNLSALSSTLIESELYGHSRGAFTGAVADRVGWLETCPQLGTVFLDEIGDLDAAIQVKLLRVLQSRTFQRLGETTDRSFQGKIIAATNQDLETKTRDGSFRNDFYFRLCSDILTTPSLQEQLVDRPADLSNLVATCVQRVVGEEAGDLSEEVVQWINEHLGHDYPWPGNFRELEQCVRNIVIRREYQPRSSAANVIMDPRDRLASEIAAGTLTAEEVLRRYCTLIYAETGSYEQTARRLKLDRRTVKSKIDPVLLDRLNPPNVLE